MSELEPMLSDFARQLSLRINTAICPPWAMAPAMDLAEFQPDVHRDLHSAVTLAFSLVLLGISCNQVEDFAEMLLGVASYSRETACKSPRRLPVSHDQTVGSSFLSRIQGRSEWECLPLDAFNDRLVQQPTPLSTSKRTGR